MFRPRARSLIGLDISSSAVKMVELGDAGKGVLRIERYAIEALPRDAVSDGNIGNLEMVAEAVKIAWKRMGTATRQVAMALPAAAVITKKIIVPAGQREEDLEATVEAEANQYIPFALEEVNLDFQPLGNASASGEELEVLIAASRKEKVEDRVAVAEAAGLKAVVMDVESYAAQAAFHIIEQQLPEGGRNKVIALIDVGANVTNVTVFRNDQPLYAREQAFGGHQLTLEITRQYGLSPDEAELGKRNGTLPENYDSELLRPFMDGLALEVSRALQFFFTSTQYNQVDHLVLAGGCAVIPGLDEVVAGRTQIHTLIANPFADMMLSNRVKPKNLATDAPSLMVACGLALRSFDE
ncbi:MAG: pilus assembly protein PilM [Betaproteobacteria bacterium]|nr:pilus assembly protein PilM [Betaproteobacteria bacterium]